MDSFELRMVLLANPEGRKKVEDGEYCWRSNADKIDPNRNWSYNFKKGTEEDRFYDSDGGQEALSTVETSSLDEAIKEFNPDVFLDVHSGMKGLLYSWASKAKDALKEDDEVKNILTSVEEIMDDIKNEDCPDCLAGEAYDMLHYESYGTSIDHNFVENRIPVSSCWEIWGDNSGLGMSARLNAMRMVKTNKKLRKKMKNFSAKAKLRFSFKMASELKFNTRDDDDNDCFDFFNPVT